MKKSSQIQPVGATALPERVSVAMAEIAENMHEGLLALAVGAGLQVMQSLMEADVTVLAGPKGKHNMTRTAVRHGRESGSVTLGGRRVPVIRPRVRAADGAGELPIPSYQLFTSTEILGKMAMEKMLAGLSTRRYPVGLEPVGPSITETSTATSKSAVSRRFVAMTETALAELLSQDLSGLDLVALMIDGVHFAETCCIVALGIDIEGNKHPLALVEGATENAATVQALLDNLVSRGLAPTVPRLFIVDGAKALSKAIRRTFGSAAAIQRCQIHKARNITERLPKEHHAATRRVLRQAWELDDADKAEKLIRNLARRLNQQWPGVAASILEGLDEILTVVRLKLPKELRRSLACTNIAENMMGTIRRVTRNVKRWRDAGMALRWVAAGMIEANKGFRRLKAHKQLSVLRAALQAHHDRMTIKPVAHVTRAA